MKLDLFKLVDILAVAAVALAWSHPVWAQTPIPPEQKAALVVWQKAQAKNAIDRKECQDIAVKVPLTNPVNVVAEQKAAFEGCIASRRGTK